MILEQCILALKCFHLQRLGSNDSSMANDQTIQALQGLTFGGSNDGIGIGLALLQARSQADQQPQVCFWLNGNRL